ncbi:MAG: CbtA family protein [Nocardioidaceae bacterium]|nr:CbtA family protein [Nocardioidaceae bacterium]
MTPRTFLVHGLLAGLFAGIAAFLVAHALGEPPLETAISLEQEHSHESGHEHENGVTVSRENQSTWGLATGTLAIGAALGGLVGLAAAVALGRLGRIRATQSTALVALVGFVAVALVPFLKYPATPPAVGDPDTIGHRTALYFSFLGLSVLAAIAAVVLAARLLPRLGTYRTVLAAAGGYLVVMVLAAELMPTVDEVGSFPASTLWEFRRSSITTLASLWAVLGVALVGLVGRTQEKLAVENARRELAASL